MMNKCKNGRKKFKTVGRTANTMFRRLQWYIFWCSRWTHCTKLFDIQRRKSCTCNTDIFEIRYDQTYSLFSYRSLHRAIVYLPKVRIVIHCD
jgi:hypothetical protein